MLEAFIDHNLSFVVEFKDVNGCPLSIRLDFDYSFSSFACMLRSGLTPSPTYLTNNRVNFVTISIHRGFSIVRIS